MKFIKVTVPILVILIFIFVMNATYIFQPFIKSVPSYFIEIEESVLNEDWDEAMEKVNTLYKELRKDKFLWMQFSIERKEMNDLITNMHQLKGSIKIKDVSNSINTLYEMRSNWNNLGG